MKKVLLLFAVMTIMISLRSAFPQSLSDYISEVKGDTLVIKDYSDMNNQPNSLYYALLLDSVDVPAGRVYELQAGGWYPLSNNPITSVQHATVIVGSDGRMVATNKDASSAPPLISGYVDIITNTGGITANGDLTIKNCALLPAANNGSSGWNFTYTTAPNLNLVFDNCIMERARARFVTIYSSNCNMTFRNCYFVNMSGQPCRRSGGVFDCFGNLDTLLVENCTHIMAQGSLYRFRGYPGDYQYSYLFNRIIINHNTFVNCAGYVFMNPGCQNNISLTNNMFVNSNIQSYPAIHTIDTYEQDPDWLPMGLLNVYPDSADVANNTPRKFMCQNNLVYWDHSLSNMDSILDANQVNGLTKWRSQMIIMNSRTDSMFKHEGPYSAAPYSYLVTDTWKNQMPAFADSKDLFTTQLVNLKIFALGTVDTNSTNVLPNWRLINTSADKFVHPDWPIPVDLSYSDADLLHAGIGGYPLGDLNWFPTQKVVWLAQRTIEYDNINDALNAGRLVIVAHDQACLPAEFQLQQNYPNPFNPITTVSWQSPVGSWQTLKVYDLLGNEVATLADEYKPAGDYKIIFNAGKLSSGVYFYRLQAGSFVDIKKFILLK